MKRIALIMPVFNNLGFTKQCIASLESQIKMPGLKHSRYDMVVIDDGSTDGTGQYLRENHPWVRVVTGDGTLWWSGGAAEGARYAVENLDADYILLWNNDIIAADDYFHQLDKLVGSIPENTIAGSKIFKKGEDARIWSYGGVFNSRTGAFYMIGTDEQDGEAYEAPRKVDWLPGMGTLIPANAFEKIGFWDAKHFPQYHGDSDFTLRAGKAGFDIMVYPELVLWNDKTTSGLKHQGTLRGLYLALTNIRSNTRIRTNLQFYRRHSNSVLAYGALCRLYFRMLGGFLKWKVLSLAGKGERNE